MDILTGLLQTAVLAGGVLALAALGEVLAERAGVVNLGVEGLVALGAVTGVAAVAFWPVPLFGFGAAICVGLVFGCCLRAGDRDRTGQPDSVRPGADADGNRPGCDGRPRLCRIARRRRSSGVWRSPICRPFR